MPYASRLTGQQIDNALMLAKSIGDNSGVPVGQGNGSVHIRELDAEIKRQSNGIPTSQAVFQAIIKNQTVAKVYTLRGSVSNYEALPASAEIGDAYHVTDRNTCYAYSAVGWVDIGNAFATVNGQPPDENGNILISASNIVTSGDISVEEALNRLKSMPHIGRNLLDNPFFTVNQRGATAYTVGAYGADRWKLVSGSATVTANGITLNGTLRQILEQKPVGEVKASVKMYSGTGSASYNSANGYFDITSSGGTVRAAKLEAGSVSTLENDQAPNYAAELAKCQRYYQRFSGGTQTYFVFALGYMQSATSCRFFLPLTVPMRTKPTINSPEAVYFNYGPSSTRVEINSFAVNNMLPNQVFISAAPASNVATGTSGEVMTTTVTGVVIELTADL